MVPVEGDVQIFADAECTEYPTGTPSALYARVNNPWDATGTWIAASYIEGAELEAAAPTAQLPDDPYFIQFGNLDDNFISSESSVPYTAGQIIQLNFSEPSGSTAWAFDGSPLVFTKN